MVSYHASPFENSFNVKTKSHVLYLLKKLIFSSAQAQAMDRPFLNPSKNKINPRHTVHNTAYCVLVIFFFTNSVNAVLLVIYTKAKLFIAHMTQVVFPPFPLFFSSSAWKYSRKV